MGKLLLDRLQPFLPLAMSDLSVRLISVLVPMLLVQLSNLSNLQTKKPDLVPQNFEVIHRIRIAHPGCLSAGCHRIQSMRVIAVFVNDSRSRC